MELEEVSSGAASAAVVCTADLAAMSVYKIDAELGPGQIGSGIGNCLTQTVSYSEPIWPAFTFRRFHDTFKYLAWLAVVRGFEPCIRSASICKRNFNES